MEALEFISAICFFTVLIRLVESATIGLVTSILVGIYKNEKIFFYEKIIKAFIVSSTIIFYALDFTSDKTVTISLLYYIIGFWTFIVIYTLADETDKETLANDPTLTKDSLVLINTSYNKYIFIISPIFFILCISFPVLTKYFIPSLCFKAYDWLMGYKAIYWIFFVFGGFVIIYIIRYTFNFLILLIKRRQLPV
jgi:hypothetical protein